MNGVSSMILIGSGGSGCKVARGVSRAYGDDMRLLLVDTDASSRMDGVDFCLLGGERLSGNGSGGSTVAARMAAEDSISAVDEHLHGVRLAVVAACLGGGTGGGATYELVKHLKELGIPCMLFATIPFSCEGTVRKQNAQGMIPLLESEANSSFFLPLDDMAAADGTLEEALGRAADALSSAMALFWRLAQKPGYIRLDAERLRILASRAGRGRFATATCSGARRAAEAVEAILAAPSVRNGARPVQTILCGILAGGDLRLAEVGEISGSLHDAFGNRGEIDVATVNDEEVFGGRISVVAMMFEQSPESASDASSKNSRAAAKRSLLARGPQGKGRFNSAEQTVWNGEDLDIPTFIRRHLTLDI